MPAMPAPMPTLMTAPMPTPTPDHAAQITVWAFVYHLGEPVSGGRKGATTLVQDLATVCRAWAARAGHSTSFTVVELQAALEAATVHGRFELRQRRGQAARRGTLVDVRPEALTWLRRWTRAARVFGPLGDPLLATRRQAEAWRAYRATQAQGGDEGALAGALKHVARVPFDLSVVASQFDRGHPRFGAWLAACQLPELIEAEGWATLRGWHEGR